MATRDALDNTLAGQTGTASYVGSTTPTITTPKIITSILDTNSNTMIGFSPTGSAVNYINITNNITTAAPYITASGSDADIDIAIFGKGTGSVFLDDGLGQAIIEYTGAGASSINYMLATNATTGNSPTFSVVGSDSNIGLKLDSKGTSGVSIKGTTAADSATAGYVGEVITSNLPQASGTSLTSPTAKNVTSISLTAGDWDVFGNIFFTPSLGFSAALATISTTSATFPDASNYNQLAAATAIYTSSNGISAPTTRINVSGTTTVYLVALAIFASGTCTASGTIYARRAR